MLISQLRKRHLMVIVVLLTLTLLSVSAGLAQGGDHILVWMGPGNAAGQPTGGEATQLAFIFPSGEVQPVMEVPANTGRVIACGKRPTAQDGRYFAFYVGNDRGELYIMQDANTITPIDSDAHVLACEGGNGLFQFSPDGNRFGYIDYSGTPGGDSFPAEGFLRIGESSSGEVTVDFDGITGFTLTDSAAYFVAFFDNTDGEATEAAVFVWDGNVDREIATLFADEDCRFTNASVSPVRDNQIAVMMGHTCQRANVTEWRMFIVDAGNRQASLAMQDSPPSNYFWYGGANNIFTSPDGAMMFFTVPDGLAANSVSVSRASVGDSQPAVVIQNGVVTRRFGNTSYSEGNHPLVVSPNGRWLAMVSNTPNNDATLYVIDLQSPDLPPITRAAGDRGDVIRDMLFTPDSNRLLYVAGVANAGNNSVVALDLELDSDFRVRRGRFGDGAVSPDGRFMAVQEWIIPDDDRDQPYLSLVTIEIDSSTPATLFVGATINEEGRTTDQQFIYPLAWLRG